MSPPPEGGRFRQGRGDLLNDQTAAPAEDQADTDSTARNSSQQVSWWSVHEHVAPTLARAGSWPAVGTPAWCDLAGDDPAKTAALLDAAQHWALRMETCQQAQRDASREVSAAVDWPALARQMSRRNSFYAAHPWLKRVVS